MTVSLRIQAMISVAAMLALGCGETRGPQGVPAASGQPCGDGGVCDPEQFCVATQGAVCLRLPPPGESCPEGCRRTSSCCLCTTHACGYVPEDRCADGPNCACLASDAGEVLSLCAIGADNCVDGPRGPEVLCVLVTEDEDPFADGG